MSEKKEPKATFAVVLLIIIASLAIFFLLSGISEYSGDFLGGPMTSLALGALGIIFVLLMFLRFMGKMSIPPPRITLTMLKCTKCAFKSIRDFQLGDYIPKPMGTCPSCGGPFVVEAIYMEEGPSRKKSEDYI